MQVRHNAEERQTKGEEGRQSGGRLLLGHAGEPLDSIEQRSGGAAQGKFGRDHAQAFEFSEGARVADRVAADFDSQVIAA